MALDNIQLDRITLGTAGQNFRTNSGATATEWVSGWETIGVYTDAAGTASRTITGLSAYRSLRIRGEFIMSSAVDFVMQFGVAGVLDTTAAHYAQLYLQNGGGATTPVGSSSTSIPGVLLSTGGPVTNPSMFTVDVGYLNKAKPQTIKWDAASSITADFKNARGLAQMQVSVAYDTIKFIPNGAATFESFIILEGLRG